MKGLILPENPLRYYKMCRLKDLPQGLTIQNVVKKKFSIKEEFLHGSAYEQSIEERWVSLKDAIPGNL